MLRDKHIDIEYTSQEEVHEALDHFRHTFFLGKKKARHKLKNALKNYYCDHLLQELLKKELSERKNYITSESNRIYSEVTI